MSAPSGNQNAVKSRVFHDMLRKAVLQDDRKRLDKAVEKLLDQAAEGDMFAMTMIRDTLDGKPKQQTEVTGADGAPLLTSIAIEFRKRDTGDSSIP